MAVADRQLMTEGMNDVDFGRKYRVTLVVEYLGWVDFDFGCSTIMLKQ